jgi:uncharacterized membrane protein
LTGLTLLGAVALLPALSAPVFAQGGQFIVVPEPSSRATGVSGDGNIVVGSYDVGGGAWRWTQSEGVQRLGGDAPFVAQAAISRDGRTIVYSHRNSQGLITAAIWEGGQNWRTLGTVPGGVPGGNDNRELSTAFSVSGDGSVIVGLAWVAGGSTGFRWDANTGMAALSRLKNRSARASIISSDGHVIAGWDTLQDPGAYSQSRAGVMWWDGLERLLHPFSWVGEVLASNSSGTVLAGRGAPSEAGYGHAVRWLAYGDGRFEDLGVAAFTSNPIRQNNPDVSTALAISEDGNTVVGTSGVGPPLAMIWTPETKMQYLGDFLRNRGITGFDGWILLECTGVSTDGKTIVGSGFDPQGVQRAIVIKLSQPIRPQSAENPEYDAQPRRPSDHPGNRVRPVSPAPIARISGR